MSLAILRASRVYDEHSRSGEGLFNLVKAVKASVICLENLLPHVYIFE